MFMDKKEKISQLIIARLDGRDINKKFKYYHSLVRKGIGGFIVFEGKLKNISNAIERLQHSAKIPLFIGSDLEQGLGQQIEEGTLFPPAMAIGQAIDRKDTNDTKLLRKSISVIVSEAKAAGINVIFSPVLDVNTNPQNPIICTRAFSDNPKEATWFGKEFIKGFQKQGVIACAKHFPGHGDTAKDSHRELPIVKADMKRLYNVELYPFRQAIKAGVKMIMVGHLKVPVLDSQSPSSLSQKVIQGLLRGEMKFKGLVITDAMNMHAVSKRNQELGEKACLMALNAGADILLHPEDPERAIDYLSSRWNEIMPGVEESFERILRAKKELSKVHTSRFPPRRTRLGLGTVYSIGTKSSWETANKLTQKSINVIPPYSPLVKGGWGDFKKGDKRGLKKPVVLVIDDDNCSSGKPFIKTIKNHYKKTKTIYIDNKYQGSIKAVLNSIYNKTLIIAVFSKISAWKGRSGLSSKLRALPEKAIKASRYSVIVGFCCPYILRELKADVVIEAYSGSELAQEAVGKILCDP